MTIRKVCGVYLIGAPNGMVYVGSSVDCAARHKQHWRALVAGKHKNPILQNIANKYGVDALTFSIHVECAKAQQFEIEQSFIDALPDALRINVANIAGGGSGPHDSATRAKMSVTRKGRKHGAKHREALSTALRSDAVREKISGGLRGKAKSDTHRRALSSAKQGANRNDNTSGFCGVNAQGVKWRSVIRHNGERRHLGYYATPELAYAMRLVYLAALPPGGV